MNTVYLFWGMIGSFFAAMLVLYAMMFFTWRLVYWTKKERELRKQIEQYERQTSHSDAEEVR